MMKAISLLLVLLLHQEAANAVPVTRSVVHSVSRRSAEYDDYLALQERDATNQCTWSASYLTCQAKNIFTGSFTKYDHHKRRKLDVLDTPQKQGKCGSCWSIALTGTFTDLRNLNASTKLPSISPQHMTACEKNEKIVIGGNGCCGGYYDHAIELLKTEGAPTTECQKYILKNYPPGKVDIYSPEGVQVKQDNPPPCASTCDKVIDNEMNRMAFEQEFIKIEDYDVIMEPDEQQVINALDDGPIVAGMEITDELITYACGIYCASESEPTDIRGHHAVEIVDYGDDTDAGIKFYVVKDSRGAWWGENGYFRIRRDDLGLGKKYPIVKIYIDKKRREKRASSNNTTSNGINPVNSMPTCSAYNVNNPTADRVVMIVANFAIEELNDLNSNHSLILCPDNTTTAGQITLSTVTNATTQVVDGTFFNISMMVKVDGCCLTGTIDATIIAEVFRDGNGTFSLSAYTYSTGAALRVSLLLVFAVIAVVMLLQ